jgi:hypothetical protein
MGAEPDDEGYLIIHLNYSAEIKFKLLTCSDIDAIKLW